MRHWGGTWSHVESLVLLTMIVMLVRQILTTEVVRLLQDVLEVSKISKPENPKIEVLTMTAALCKVVMSFWWISEIFGVFLFFYFMAYCCILKILTFNLLYINACLTWILRSGTSLLEYLRNWLGAWQGNYE